MIARNAVQVIRDVAARREALRQLAADFDRHAEDEQLLVERGFYAEAESAHEAGRLLVKAWAAEMSDPEPQ